MNKFIQKFNLLVVHLSFSVFFRFEALFLISMAIMFQKGTGVAIQQGHHFPWPYPAIPDFLGICFRCILCSQFVTKNKPINTFAEGRCSQALKQYTECIANSPLFLFIAFKRVHPLVKQSRFLEVKMDDRGVFVFCRSC